MPMSTRVGRPGGARLSQGPIYTAQAHLIGQRSAQHRRFVGSG
jgi:hypothetical protein